jgi:hypothetical protein
MKINVFTQALIRLDIDDNEFSNTNLGKKVDLIELSKEQVSAIKNSNQINIEVRRGR